MLVAAYKRLFLSIVLYSIFSTVHAQINNQYFSPLSSVVYTNKISAIKERKIPIVYSEKKEQKTYAGLIQERNLYILNSFLDNRLVADSLLLSRCDKVIQKIKAANKKYKFEDISAYISRSPVANACSNGDGTLFINLGLFLWLDNEDELALVLGHELSHQFLNHQESLIKKNIAMMTSDEFIAEMRDIKKSSDGKYERYKSLMKDLAVQNGTHSRYKETEADSLGFELAQNAGYNTGRGALVLLKLNNVDELFISPKIYNAREFFQKAGVDMNVLTPSTKYHGLSMSTVKLNADKDFDSIKTHPNCIVRFQKLTKEKKVPEVTCCNTLSMEFQELKERALIELIRNEYDIKHFTNCIHLCFFAIQNGLKDPLYSTFISLSFSGIYQADKRLEKFNVTDSKAYPGSTLKSLQDIIFNANSTIILQLSSYFLNTIDNKNTDNFYYAKMKYEACARGDNNEYNQSKFSQTFPTSKFNFL